MSKTSKYLAQTLPACFAIQVISYGRSYTNPPIVSEPDHVEMPEQRLPGVD